MGFMDKLKQSATSAKDSMKKTFDETSAAMKARNEESKELKKPLDGAIERYEVTYVSGLPDIPKRKAGAIGLNIMPECFSFRSTITTKEWFPDYDIPYNKISELRIEKRTISTTEVFLGAGDSANQEQENVICILYTDGDGKKLTLRVEMLTGTTIFNQAAKCREFMDLLRQYEIKDKFEAKDKNESNSSSNGTDVLAQIEKLNQLKLAGILTEEEFSSKKADLLSKL